MDIRLLVQTFAMQTSPGPHSETRKQVAPSAPSLAAPPQAAMAAHAPRRAAAMRITARSMVRELITKVIPILRERW